MGDIYCINCDSRNWLISERDWENPEYDRVRRSVYRFWNRQQKAHFFTISTGERDLVIANDETFIDEVDGVERDVWKYEGLAFVAYESKTPHTVPLYRFYSKTYKVHFYTISLPERDQLIATDDNWTYEGIGFYVHNQAYDLDDQTASIHRFWSPVFQAHFFTLSDSESDGVKLDSNWTYEGTPFRAYGNDD